MAINLSIINKTSVCLFFACVLPNRFLSLFTKVTLADLEPQAATCPEANSPECQHVNSRNCLPAILAC